MNVHDLLLPKLIDGLTKAHLKIRYRLGEDKQVESSEIVEHRAQVADYFPKIYESNFNFQGGHLQTYSSSTRLSKTITLYVR